MDYVLEFNQQKKVYKNGLMNKKKYFLQNLDVELPPLDDLDDDGNYIGTDSKFLKSFNNGTLLDGEM